MADEYDPNADPEMEALLAASDETAVDLTSSEAAPSAEAEYAPEPEAQPEPEPPSGFYVNPDEVWIIPKQNPNAYLRQLDEEDERFRAANHGVAGRKWQKTEQQLKRDLAERDLKLKEYEARLAAAPFQGLTQQQAQELIAKDARAFQSWNDAVLKSNEVKALRQQFEQERANDLPPEREELYDRIAADLERVSPVIPEWRLQQYRDKINAGELEGMTPLQAIEAFRGMLRTDAQYFTAQYQQAAAAQQQAYAAQQAQQAAYRQPPQAQPAQRLPQPQQAPPVNTKLARLQADTTQPLRSAPNGRPQAIPRSEWDNWSPDKMDDFLDRALGPGDKNDVTAAIKAGLLAAS